MAYPAHERTLVLFNHDFDQIAHRKPLSGMAHHEGLGDDDTLWRLAQLLRVPGRQCNGLLAQNMFASPSGLQGERHMEVIGKRIVDSLDLRIRQHLLIGAIGLRDAELGSPGLGSLAASR